MKHILHKSKDTYSKLFWAFHDEKKMQMPQVNNYTVGDIILLSPQGISSTIVITSKKEITLTLPDPIEIYTSTDMISQEVTSMRGCYFHNKCDTEEIKLHIVQCFRPNKGYELLAHTCSKFATWCLVVESELKEFISYSFDFNALLKDNL